MKSVYCITTTALMLLCSSASGFVPLLRFDDPRGVSHSPTELGMVSNAAQIRRINMAGVSVSKQGFWVMFQVPGAGYWPIQVTSDDSDAFAATSPESLTLLQLISGVDMAGAVLPPEVLAKMLVFQAEFDPQSSFAKEILGFVQETLPEGTTYSQTNEWQRAKVLLPQVTLDEVEVDPLTLECSVQGLGSVSLHPTEEILREVCLNYDHQSSAMFTAVALALRYAAPIIISSIPSSSHLLEDDVALNEKFPMYRSCERLQETSQRVFQDIEKGFEAQKLAGALRIAMEKGDHRAVEKIQAKLEEYDRMDDLPTLEIAEDGLDQME